MRRRRSAILLSTIRQIPAAASCTSRPSGSATVRSRLGCVAIDFAAPVEKLSGSTMPSTTSASSPSARCPASAVARRAGIRPADFRTDVETARLVEMGDAASSGADQIDVDHRQGDLRSARAPTPRAGRARHADDTHVERSAAHVRDDDWARRSPPRGTRCRAFPSPARSGPCGSARPRASRAVIEPPAHCAYMTRPS